MSNPRSLLCILAAVLTGGCACGWQGEVAPPYIPKAVFNIRDFGAVGDGTTSNTRAIQKAIDACAAAGGGTLVVPAGRFLTGPITLTSNLDVHLDKDSTLLLSDKLADFKIVLRNSPTSEKEKIEWFEHGFFADHCHDIAVTGSGTIDGQGAMWWKKFLEPKNPKPGQHVKPHRGYLLVFSDCSRVLVSGITLINSPMEHVVPEHCRDVLIENLNISSPKEGKNTDGIDPSGINIVIRNCVIASGDDNIAIKPKHVIEPGHPAVENMLIENCQCKIGHGISIGGQTPGGMRNLIVRNCTFDGTDAGIRMKAPRDNGGLVENLRYENLTMKNVKFAISICSYYPESGMTPDDPPQQITATTPIWRHIRIDNVTADGGENAGRILGLPEMPVSDVVLNNVHISAVHGMVISHANGIEFTNSQIQATNGPPIKILNSQVQGIDAATGK